MKRVSLTAARRYARALLDVAQQGDPAAVREDLRAARALLEGHAELADALAHPALPAAKKRGLLRAALQASLQAPVLRLLELLVERGRLDLLGAIDSAYAALWNAQRGVAAAEVVSAAPLQADEQRALQAALERASGLRVELSTRQDPALLGGLLVHLGGRSYDGSVRGRLAALRARLAGGPAA